MQDDALKDQFEHLVLAPIGMEQLKYVSMELGVQCAMISGMIWMLECSVGNLVIHHMVCSSASSFQIKVIIIFLIILLLGALSSNDFSSSPLQINLMNVNCLGNEDSLLRCEKTFVPPLQSTVCSTKAGVLCQGTYHSI